jgi:hypothetical protein
MIFDGARAVGLFYVRARGVRDTHFGIRPIQPRQSASKRSIHDCSLFAASRLFICLRIRFEYRDGFHRNCSPKTRVQNFGYMPNSLFGVGYLPKYNDSN